MASVKNSAGSIDSELSRRPVFVVLGSTGSGKSELCNTLAGNNLFPVSEKPSSCTYKTTKKTIKFLGWGPEAEIIDTPGLGDSDGRDTQHIAEMVTVLKDVGVKFGGVNAFAIVFNGQQARFDGYLKAMIQIFNGIFTSDFLDNVVLVFTRWAYDNKSVKRRLRAGDTEAKKVAAFNEHFRREFGAKKDIPCIFVDSLYDKDDAEEATPTEAEFGKLAKIVTNLEKFPCKDFKAVKGQVDELECKVEESKAKAAAEAKKRQAAEKARRDTEQRRKEEGQKAQHQRQLDAQKLKAQQSQAAIVKAAAKREEELTKQRFTDMQKLQQKRDEENAKTLASSRAQTAAANKRAEENAKAAARRGSSSGGCSVM